MLKKIMGPNFVEKRPKKHQITIFEKQGRRGIKNMKEMLSFIIRKYGGELLIKVVNPESLELQKQIELILETTLLISPCGKK